MTGPNTLPNVKYTPDFKDLKKIKKICNISHNYLPIEMLMFGM